MSKDIEAKWKQHKNNNNNTTNNIERGEQRILL